MAYSKGPYRTRAALPSPPRPEIHSSRSIDFATGTYEINATTGGNEPMNSVAQRVVLIVNEANRDAPADVITDQANAEREDKIRKALAVLAAGPKPVIAIESVSVESLRAGAVDEVVTFRDLGEWTDQTKQLD